MVEKWSRWHKKELAILEQHYPSMTRDELMQLLPGRSWHAIVLKAHKREIKRPYGRGRGATRTEKQLAELHKKLSASRRNRIAGYAPFRGHHHSAEAKMQIAVRHMRTAGRSVAEIAVRKGITEEEVKKIIGKRS